MGILEIMHASMKRFVNILSVGLAAVLASACYDEYVKDFDYTSVYFANQYDLRTFVIGESESFDVGVVLGGTISNTRDRVVSVTLDNSLVDGDLSVFQAYDPDSETEITPFTAYDGMMGAAPIGVLINPYVTNEFRAMPTGFSALKPLPSAYFNVEGDLSAMCIAKGRHTATVTLKADVDELTSNLNTVKPYYALGLRILKADADTVLQEKSFEVIAVKYENRFFGNWYHGGKAVTVDDATGDVVDRLVYPTPFPQSEDEIYVLSTVGADALETNRVSKGQIPGLLTLTFDGDDVEVLEAYGRLKIKPYGEGSHVLRAHKLQDRRIYLNYQIDNENGTHTIVTDTLTFRNRIRDGINEWQDENPANYD